MRRRHPADGAFGTQEMLLAHDLVEALGPQAVGQRGRRVRRQAGGLEEIGHVSVSSRPTASSLLELRL
jgi:hypothetical protein